MRLRRDRKQGADDQPEAKAKATATAQVKAKKARPPREKVPWSERLMYAALCVVSGALVFTSFPFRTAPDSNIWPFTWFALVPLLWALQDATPRQGFWRGWLTGFVTNFGGFWWIAGLLEEFGHLPPAVAWPLCALNAAYQGLAFALFGYLVCKLRPAASRGTPSEARSSVFRVAAVFTASELVFPLIFPWFLANSQYRFLPAIQIADLVGVSGVTFVIVMVNASLHELVVWRVRKLTSFSWRPLAVVAGIVAATLVYGGVRLSQVQAVSDEAKALKIGLVEANIGIWEKEAKGFSPDTARLTLHGNLLTHQRMAAELEAQGVELILWPESSYFPLGNFVYAKRSNDFAVGVTAEGRLATWRDQGGDGFQWHLGEPLPGGAGTLRAVAAAREDSVVAVGDDGRAVRWDGRVAAELQTSTKADLLAVAVATDRAFNDRSDGVPVVAWAAGKNGALLRGSPAEGLARVDSHTTQDLFAVALSDGATGAAVGAGGTVVPIVAGKARPLMNAGSDDLHAAWMTPAGTAIFVAGASGAMHRRTPSRWIKEATPTAATLRALVGDDANGRLWALGDGGTVLRRTAAKGASAKWVREKVAGAPAFRAAALDARGVPLASAADGSSWRRDGEGVWAPLEAPGLGPLVGMASLPYVRVETIPRDVRYLYQSDTPVPSHARFAANPDAEYDLPAEDRSAVQRGFRTPVVFGGITRGPYVPDERQRIYNTALMLDELGRIRGSYDKVYLLMFGEYIPFGDWFPKLYEMIPAAGRFEPGTSVEVFEWAGLRLGVMICYEDILPQFNQRLLAKRPNIILNVTNDAWFGKTSEPYLHLALAVFRSVESRLAMVRSTNTGVSAFIAPTGEIVGQTGLDGAETLIRSMPIMEGGTVYATIGDAFGYGTVVWVVGLGIGGFLRRRRRKTKTKTTTTRTT